MLVWILFLPTVCFICRFCVAEGSIFVAGYANGGMMAYRLACQLSKRIKAVAIYAGALLHKDFQPCMEKCKDYTYLRSKCFDDEKCSSLDRLNEAFKCSPESVSVLAVHGMQDPKIPYDGGIGEKSAEKVAYMPVKTTVELFAKANGCTLNPSIIMQNNTQSKDAAKCVEYKECRCSRVVLCSLANGGHTLAGMMAPKYCNPGSEGKKKRLCDVARKEMGPSSFSLDFTDTAWDFFRSAMQKTVTSRSVALEESKNHVSSCGLKSPSVLLTIFCVCWRNYFIIH